MCVKCYEKIGHEHKMDKLGLGFDEDGDSKEHTDTTKRVGLTQTPQSVWSSHIHHRAGGAHTDTTERVGLTQTLQSGWDSHRHYRAGGTRTDTTKRVGLTQTPQSWWGPLSLQRLLSVWERLENGAVCAVC